MTDVGRKKREKEEERREIDFSSRVLFAFAKLQTGRFVERGSTLATSPREAGSRSCHFRRTRNLNLENSAEEGRQGRGD